MKEINLTNSCLVAWVDDEDFERVSQHKWDLNEWGYARTWINGHTWSMDEFIMGYIGGGVVYDHKNRNKLDNRKENLRKATNLQNQANKGPRKTNTSGYKGVFWHRSGRWRAQIYSGGRCIHLGMFNTPEEAARAYDRAAILFNGEFAYTNFPREQYS